MTLKVHHLRPAPGSHTKKTRVGRGEGGKGKTAGRGTKGTKARYQVPAAFEGGQMPLHMRLPKLKGFKNPFRTEYQVVNLDQAGRAVPGRRRPSASTSWSPPVPSARTAWSRCSATATSPSPCRSPRTSSAAPPATRSPLPAARSPSSSTTDVR